MICLCGAETPRRGLHDVCASVVDYERTVLRMGIPGPRRGHDNPAVEAFAGAKFLFSDLMAHRTRNAVFGCRIFLGIAVERKMGEYLAQAALQLCLVAGDGHVGVRTAVFELGA